MDPRFPRPDPAAASSFLAMKERMAQERAARAGGPSPATLPGASTASRSFEWMQSKFQKTPGYTAVPRAGASANAAPMPGRTGPAYTFNPSPYGGLRRDPSVNPIWVNNVPTRDWRGNLLADPAAYWSIRVKAAAIIIPILILTIVALGILANVLFSAPPPEPPHGPDYIEIPDGIGLWHMGNVEELVRSFPATSQEPMAEDGAFAAAHPLPGRQKAVETISPIGWFNVNAQHQIWIPRPDKSPSEHLPDVLFLGDQTMRMWIKVEEDMKGGMGFVNGIRGPDGELARQMWGACGMFMASAEGEAYGGGYPPATCESANKAFKRTMHSFAPFSSLSWQIDAIPEATVANTLFRVRDQDGGTTWGKENLEPLVIVLGLGGYDLEDDAMGGSRVKKAIAVEQVASNYMALVKELLTRFPHTQLLLLPALPRGTPLSPSTPDDLMEQRYLDNDKYYQGPDIETKGPIPALNDWYRLVAADLVARFPQAPEDGGQRIHFKDCGPELWSEEPRDKKHKKDPPRLYLSRETFPDRVYLSAQGHEKYLQCLQPAVHELVMRALEFQGMDGSIPSYFVQEYPDKYKHVAEDLWQTRQGR